MATAYITAADGGARLLSRFNITATLSNADVEIASDELDSLRPFIGDKQATDGTQPRQFPRNINPDGTENTDPAVPEPILDGVVLLAYQAVEDEGPAIKSHSVLDLSITYASPKVSQASRRILALVSPYLLRTGVRL